MTDSTIIELAALACGTSIVWGFFWAIARAARQPLEQEYLMITGQWEAYVKWHATRTKE